MRTAVLLLIFNRPETTGRVLAAIRAARPGRLYVAADGPRSAQEAARCAAAREAATRIDWPCELRTLYREHNLGCRAAVSDAISWFFTQEEQGIVLEDDCVPHPSFFRFAQELLERYADDERVFTISGNNFQFGRPRPAYSYYFSRYVHVWGWATWRRSWKHYDVSLRDWPGLRESGWLERHLQSAQAVRFWRRAFDSTYAAEVDSWAHQMTFACWRQNALNALPGANLVSNIGFGAGATNTKSRAAVGGLHAAEMGFPLRHPTELARDAQADAFTQAAVLDPPVLRKIVNRVSDAIRQIRG